MDNINTPQNNNPGNVLDSNLTPKNLPNAVAVLVLGICSIFPGCFCCGLVGLICGIIALVLAKKDLTLYNANPGAYTESSIKNLKAGRVCSIIGLCLSGLYLVFFLLYFIIVGTAISMMPWGNMH
jgi:hypothetical protein